MYSILVIHSVMITQDGAIEPMSYGEFTIQLDLVDGLPREIYITNMSTLVSNSDYKFEVLLLICMYK